MDLTMLVLLGSRERTAAEFEALLSRAGWQLRRTVSAESPDGLHVLEAFPSTVDS
jgi:hypothetical protein